MAPPSLTYRTAGDWGSGKGANLTPAEVDGNFWSMIQWFATEVAGLPSANGIASVTVSADNVMDVYLDDGTHFGPFTIATNTLNWSGEWTADTPYSVNDIVSVMTGTNAGIYLVTEQHTSASTFDPAEGPGYYSLMLTKASGSGGSGGIQLVEAQSNDPPGSPYEGSWIVGWSPTGDWTGQAGKIATWDGVEWSFASATDGTTVFDYTDGTFKVYYSSDWNLLGETLWKVQGLTYLGVGGYANSSYPISLQADDALIGAAAADFNLWLTRAGHTNSVYQYFRTISTNFNAARFGMAGSSASLKFEIRDTYYNAWRAGLTFAEDYGFVKFRSVTYSQLPAASSTYEGYRCFVTDATVNTFGATISAGSGGYKVPAWCDGSNWLVG